MTTKVNPYDGKLIQHPDEVSKTLGTIIPELNSDPVDPQSERAWVLREAVGIGGSPIGLLLSLTYSGAFRHFFSYRTVLGITKRVELLP